MKHFNDMHGPSLASAFDRYLKLRQYYFDEKNVYAATMIENLVKNHVGIRRLVGESPNFVELHVGKVARFHEGKFLGWQGEDDCDADLQGIIAYEI